jgi:hypothetical protein
MWRLAVRVCLRKANSGYTSKHDTVRMAATYYLRWQVPEEVQWRPTELSHGSRTAHFSPFCLPQVKQQSRGSGSLTSPYPAGQNSVRFSQFSFSSESDRELPPTSAHFFTSQEKAPWNNFVNWGIYCACFMTIFVLFSVAISCEQIDSVQFDLIIYWSITFLALSGRFSIYCGNKLIKSFNSVESALSAWFKRFLWQIAFYIISAEILIEPLFMLSDLAIRQLKLWWSSVTIEFIWETYIIAFLVGKCNNHKLGSGTLTCHDSRVIW